MQILTIANQKGGTAKTTTAAALAQAAQKDGQRALCVDLDPQGNLTHILKGNGNTSKNAFALLTGTAPAADCIQQTKSGVDLIAGNWNLATISTAAGSANRLRAALDGIKQNYDFIIIDTPPTMNDLMLNALQASNGLLIPANATALSLQAFYLMRQTAEQIQASSNAALKIYGVIITNYTGRNNIEKTLHQKILEAAKAAGIDYLGTVRRAVAIEEAAAMQSGIFDYAPKAKPVEDYLTIYKKIILKGI